MSRRSLGPMRSRMGAIGTGANDQRGYKRSDGVTHAYAENDDG